MFGRRHQLLFPVDLVVYLLKKRRESLAGAETAALTEARKLLRQPVDKLRHRRSIGQIWSE